SDGRNSAPSASARDGGEAAKLQLGLVLALIARCPADSPAVRNRWLVYGGNKPSSGRPQWPKMALPSPCRQRLSRCPLQHHISTSNWEGSRVGSARSWSHWPTRPRRRCERSRTAG